MAQRRSSHRVIRNVLFSLVNEALGFGMVFFSSAYIARRLKPENLGIFSYILWFVSVITVFLGMGFMTGISKYISEFEEQGKRAAGEQIFSFVLRIEIILSVVVAGILIGFRNTLADFAFSPAEGFVFGLAFLGILPGMVSGVMASAIRGLQCFEYFTYFSLTVSPLNLLAKIACVYIGWGIPGLLWIQLFFSLVTILFYIVVLKKFKFRISLTGRISDANIKKRFTRFNARTVWVMILDFIIWDKSETFFLGRFSSATQIAFYTLPYNIVKRFMGVFPKIFWEVLLPTLSGFHSRKDRYRMKRTYYLACRYIAFASWPVGIGGIVLAYPFLKYVYGMEYVAAENVLQILFFSSLVVSLDAPAGALIFAMEKQSFVIKVGVVLAVINLIMNFLLIPRLGALGAAISIGFIHIVASLVGLIWVFRIAKMAYPIRSVSKIIFSSIFMGLAMGWIIKTNGGLFGFFVSLGVGPLVYLVSAIVLGSFEEEDFEILKRFGRVIPKPFSKFSDTFIAYIAAQKNISTHLE